jgi:hypothetical protein
MTTPFTATFETITPKKANAYLCHNTRNRVYRQRAVDRYAKLMADGKWKYNGDTIRFSADGVLLDGQQRLMACLKAKKPFETLVVRSLPAERFVSIDSHAARTAGDVLSVEKVPYHNYVAAAARLCLLMDSGSFTTSGKNLSSDAINDYVLAHPELVKFTADFNTFPRRLMPQSVIAAAATQAAGNAPYDSVLDFFQLVAAGEGLSKGDPAYALRERLMRLCVPPVTHEIKAKMIHACAAAWNAHTVGRRITKLIDKSWGYNAPEFK